VNAYLGLGDNEQAFAWLERAYQEHSQILQYIKVRRSWSVKTNGWYRAFLKEPRGTVQVADREIAVRAIRTKSEGLRDAVDRQPR
jgi:hypothetical protein